MHRRYRNGAQSWLCRMQILWTWETIHESQDWHRNSSKNFELASEKSTYVQLPDLVYDEDKISSRRLSLYGYATKDGQWRLQKEVKLMELCFDEWAAIEDMSNWMHQELCLSPTTEFCGTHGAEWRQKRLLFNNNESRKTGPRTSLYLSVLANEKCSIICNIRKWLWSWIAFRT